MNNQGIIKELTMNNPAIIQELTMNNPDIFTSIFKRGFLPVKWTPRAANTSNHSQEQESSSSSNHYTDQDSYT